MALSILISETDDRWADEMKSFLLQKSYDVDQSLDGKDCQLKLYKKNYLAVILDIDTHHHSGLEVLKYLRLNTPSVKVILTFQNKKRFEDLELSKDDVKKLGASDILIKPFSLEILLGSVEGSNQFDSWKNVKKSNDVKDEEPVNANDEEFTRIKISDYVSGNTTIFDTYIRLAKGKYVKVLHKGDSFDEDRINKYLNIKEITHLYFKTKDRANYINFVNKVLEKIIKNTSVPIEKKVSTAKNLTEKYIEEIYTVGLKPQLIEEGKLICSNICNVIQRDPDLSRLLALYQDYDPPAYAHLFLVSFMSTIIAKNMDWSSQRTIELVAFGSLLHDIGKLKLPERLRGKRSDEMSPEEFELYKKHPQFGAEMLQQYPIITEPIRQIVYQHHEYVNGEGFPNGLPGIKIYPLAKFVALADDFTNILFKFQTTPIEGLRKFIPDRRITSRHDPQILKSLVQGFIRDKK